MNVVYHARKGARIPTELTYYTAWGGAEALLDTYRRYAHEHVKTLNSVGKQSKRSEYSWREHMWFDGDALRYDMFLVLPLDVYTRYVTPEVNEWGEVAP